MTPVSSVKTTESYVKTKESYVVCRLGHHMDSKERTRLCGSCTAAIACLLLLFRRLDCSLVKYKLISSTNGIIIKAI